MLHAYKAVLKVKTNFNYFRIKYLVIFFLLLFFVVGLVRRVCAENPWDNPPPDVCPELSLTPNYIVKAWVSCTGGYADVIIEDNEAIFSDGCSSWRTDHWETNDCTVDSSSVDSYWHWSGIIDGIQVDCDRNYLRFNFHDCDPPSTGCGYFPECGPGYVFLVGPYGCSCLCTSLNQWCTGYVAFPDGNTFTVKCNYVGGGYQNINTMGVVYGCDADWNCLETEDNIYGYVNNGVVNTQAFTVGNYRLRYPNVFLYCLELDNTIGFDFTGMAPLGGEGDLTLKGRGHSFLHDVKRSNKRFVGHGGYEKRTY